MPNAPAHQQPTVEVIHNLAASRFEATVDGQLSIADYRIHGQVMDMPHTYVPKALEGRGIAALLVAAAVAYAQAKGLKVRPSCSYVTVYMQRHPELHALRA
jgi:uncharacterized protein